MCRSTVSVVSTDHSVPCATDETWRLHRSVTLRREPFGAIAYHFGTRRLSFLKTKRLADVIEGLATSPNLGQAMADAGVEPREWGSYLKAVQGLAASGMLRREGSSP